MSRVAWSALTTGLALAGGSLTTLTYARFGWHPTDPFALTGAFALGALVGLFVAAFVADGLTRIDRAVGHDPATLDLDDVLRLARAVGVTEDGAR